MKARFQTLRLLAKHLWPPIRKSGLPTAVAAFAAVVLFSLNPGMTGSATIIFLLAPQSHTPVGMRDSSTAFHGAGHSS